jgi:hypothetical protein
MHVSFCAYTVTRTLHFALQKPDLRRLIPAYLPELVAVSDSPRLRAGAMHILKFSLVFYQCYIHMNLSLESLPIKNSASKSVG